jgi:hypothetical protein
MNDEVMTHSRRQKIMQSPEWKNLAVEVRRLFREKFGREQGPDDPFFFDPDADTPQPLTEETVKQYLEEAATAAGVHPRIIYAMNKTGLIVTEDAYHRLSDYKRRAWDDACAEYDDQQRLRRQYAAWLRAHGVESDVD